MEAKCNAQKRHCVSNSESRHWLSGHICRLVECSVNGNFHWMETKCWLYGSTFFPEDLIARWIQWIICCTIRKPGMFPYPVYALSYVVYSNLLKKGTIHLFLSRIFCQFLNIDIATYSEDTREVKLWNLEQKQKTEEVSCQDLSSFWCNLLPLSHSSIRKSDPVVCKLYTYRLQM